MVLALVLSLLPSMAAAQVSLAVSNLTSTSATLTIANHGTAWSYSPDNGTTCGTVNSGTTANLSVLTPGTSYTYVAYNTTTCGPTSAEIARKTFTTLALTASAVTATTATLTIKNHEGDWYYKYTAPTGGQCSSVQTGTTASLATLTPGTNYTFKAYSNSSCSTELATAAFLTKPGQTTGVTVAVLGTKLKVSWTAVTSATGYTVQWKSGNQDYASSRQATATGTSHTVTGLTNSTTYTLQVQATNGTGDGAWSADATGTPAAVTLTVSDITQTMATLTIANYEGAWSYSPDNGTTCGTVNSGTTANLSVLTPGTSYTYVAYNTTICGPTSAEIARKTFTTVDLTASAVTATTATLTIENHEGDWYYKANAAPDNSCKGPVNAGTVTKALAELSGNTSYTYSAYSDSACSTELAEADAFLTKPAKPATPTVKANVGSGQLTLASSVAGGSGALTKWQYTTDDGTTWKDISVTATALSYTVSGLTDGTSYTFKVRAVNATGEGAASDGTAATPTAESLTVSDITRTSAKLTLGNYDGDWSYSGTADGSDCQAVTAGTTEVSLSGLKPGTRYTYKAFSTSTCTDASSVLADPGGVTFTTLTTLTGTRESVTLTTSAVKATTATVTISGHTGHWSYQVSSPGTQCTAVLDGTTSVTLTGLTPGTTYTSTVYSDRDCTQKIASQTFTTLNEPLTFLPSRTIDAQSYVQHTSVALTLPAATGGNPPLTYALAPGLPCGADVRSRHAEAGGHADGAARG